MEFGQCSGERYECIDDLHHVFASDERVKLASEWHHVPSRLRRWAERKILVD